MAQKVLHAVFNDPEATLREAAAVLGGGLAGVEQAEVLRDKSIVEGQLKKEQGSNKYVELEAGICSLKTQADMRASHILINSISGAYAMRILLADVAVNQQPDIYRQPHPFQFAGIYVRPPGNLLVFPIAVHDAVHDAVHAGVHQLVQRGILFHAIPPDLVSYLTSETGD